MDDGIGQIREKGGAFADDETGCVEPGGGPLVVSPPAFAPLGSLHVESRHRRLAFASISVAGSIDFS